MYSGLTYLCLRTGGFLRQKCQSMLARNAIISLADVDLTLRLTKYLQIFLNSSFEM
jgi:hypothetical protein